MSGAMRPLAHVDDYPGCPCNDCRQLRFDCWRVSVESGSAVLWQDGRWMLADDDDVAWETGWAA